MMHRRLLLIILIAVSDTALSFAPDDEALRTANETWDANPTHMVWGFA